MAVRIEVYFVSVVEKEIVLGCELHSNVLDLILALATLKSKLGDFRLQATGF